MKIRQGFVSNSSSSSFVVRKLLISEKQLDCIHNVRKIAEESGISNVNHIDGWSIIEDRCRIVGRTDMDNFDFIAFLKDIGLKEGKHFTIGE